MLYLIISLFALGAVMGLIIATSIFTKNPPVTPKPAVVAHGLFVATALILLVVYWINNPDNRPTTSLVVFLIAALGGFALVYTDLVRKSPGPKGLVVVHALVAVTAFILLLAFVFF